MIERGTLVYCRRYGDIYYSNMCRKVNKIFGLLTYIRSKLERRKKTYIEWYKNYYCCLYKVIEVNSNAHKIRCLYCNNEREVFKDSRFYVEKIPAEHFIELVKEFKVKLLWI